MAQRKTEQTENEQLSVHKITFRKTSRCQRHSNDYCLRKSRVAQGVPPPIKPLLLIYPLGEKGSPKVYFLEIPKIENVTKIDQWRQDRHQDPLKTLSGNGFEKHEKSMKLYYKTNVFLRV